MIVYLKVLAAAIGLLKMSGPHKGGSRVKGVLSENNEVYIDLPKNSETQSKALHSMFWNSRKSHALVQAHAVQPSDSVVRFRVVEQFSEGLPTAGDKVALSGWLGETPEHFGLESKYTEALLPSGTRGWFFPNESNTWVIHVHGRRASMGETLRNVEQFAMLGYSQLTISMRTDPKPFGKGTKVSHLGHREWQEVQDAVRFALSSGAKDVILFGWSQGALLCGLFLNKAPEASSVRAAFFDSPLLDYRTTMRFHAQRGGHDPALGDRVIDSIQRSRAVPLLGYRNVDVDELSLIRKRSTHEKPVLILYSKSDGHVAIDDVGVFAQINENVKLVEFDDARHCRLFNEDQTRYQTAISDFLLENRI